MRSFPHPRGGDEPTSLSNRLAASWCPAQRGTQARHPQDIHPGLVPVWGCAALLELSDDPPCNPSHMLPGFSLPHRSILDR